MTARMSHAGNMGPSGPTDPYFSNVKLLLPMGGANGSTTFVDVTGKPMTAVANAKIDTSVLIHGIAPALFDGALDRITTPSHADFNVGTGDFTHEWFQIWNSSVGYQLLHDRAYSAAGGCTMQSRNNEYRYESIVDGGGGVYETTSATPGVVYHYAHVRESGVVRLHRAGIVTASGTQAGSINASAPFSIGARAADGVYAFNGRVGQYRFSNFCRYPGGTTFIPPTSFPTVGAEVGAANVKLWLRAGGADGSPIITDSALVPHTITVAGNTQIDTSLGFNTIVFDATGDFATTPYVPADFDWWTQDYDLTARVVVGTLSDWSYLDGVQKPALIGCADPASGTNYWSFGPRADGKLAFAYYSGAPQLVASAASVTPGTTVDITMRKRSSGISLAVNGFFETPVAIVGTPQSSPTAPVKLTIGQISNRSISGHLRELQIIKGPP